MSTQRRIEVSISIVSYNTRDCLKECLCSIESNVKSLEYEIIVVDNGSQDSTVSMIEREFPYVKLIKNKRNVFFARANNQAMRASCGQYILLLNSDTLFRDNSLKHMLDFMENNPDVGAVSGRILCLRRTGQESCGWKLRGPMEEIRNLLFMVKLPLDSVQKNSAVSDCQLATAQLNNCITTTLDTGFCADLVSVDVVSDCFILLRREAIFQIGLYDERLLLYYTEDDICRRLKSTGWKIFCLPDASIMHKLFESSRKVPTVKILFIGIIDGMRYYNKHYGFIVSVVIGFFFTINFVKRVFFSMIAKG